METIYFLGIDISKKKLDAALTIDGRHFQEVQIENRTKTILAFVRELKKKFSSLDNLVVCVEHTGVYGMPLLDVLVKNKIKICVHAALQIKKSLGITRGKNDRVDAMRIAQYSFKNKEDLVFWKPQRDCLQKLKALLVTRERLVKTRVQLEVPLAECSEFIAPSIRKDMTVYCRQAINAIRKDIMRIEKAINELVRADTQICQQRDIATSVPGIGNIVALNMIISTNEFTKISESKQFACYCGVAPFDHRSGSSIRGKTRVSKMANMTLKRLVHLAAMSAIRWNEELQAYYLRKVKGGKNKMSVLNAVRNKLISRVFACIKNRRKYEKIYQNVLA